MDNKLNEPEITVLLIKTILIEKVTFYKILKIDLLQFLSDKVIEILSNAESLKFLADNNNFKNDHDITQDFTDLINKGEVNTWLLITRDFRMQGSYGSATHTILDNNFIIFK